MRRSPSGEMVLEYWKTKYEVRKLRHSESLVHLVVSSSGDTSSHMRSLDQENHSMISNKSQRVMSEL